MLFFAAAAPVAPGGREPAVSHHVLHQWSDLEPFTPGFLLSYVTTPLRCPPPSPAHHLPRFSPHTLSSRTQLCPRTQLPTPSPSWRRLGGGWRKRGGETHYSRPSRGRCKFRNDMFASDSFNLYLCVYSYEKFDVPLVLLKAQVW